MDEIHPEIYQNALAGLTLEHLGCTMWADDANGRYLPTGEYEWGATYTTQKQGSLNLRNLEQQAYLAAVRATNGSGAIDQPIATMLPLPLFVGEGAPLYAGGLGRFRCARCRPTCCRRVLEPSRSC